MNAQLCLTARSILLIGVMIAGFQPHSNSLASTQPVPPAKGALVSMTMASSVTMLVTGSYFTNGINVGERVNQQVVAIAGPDWGELRCATLPAPILWDRRTRLARFPFGDRQAWVYLYFRDVPTFQDLVLDLLCGMLNVSGNRLRFTVPHWSRLLKEHGRTIVLWVRDYRGHRSRLRLEYQPSHASANWLRLKSLLLRRDDAVGGLLCRLDCVGAVREAVPSPAPPAQARNLGVEWEKLLERWNGLQ